MGDDFDGQLIYCIDKRVASVENLTGLASWESLSQNSVYPPVLFLGKSQKSPVSLRVGGETLAWSIAVEKSRSGVSPANDAGRFDKRYELSPMLADANQREILDIIYDGRIRLSVLLNSSGGEVDAGNEIIKLFHYVREKGGVIDAYVSSVAESMAARIFEEADNRFVLNDSMAMWHRTHGSAINTDEKKRKAMEDHRRSFSDFVTRTVIAEKRDKLMAALDRACSGPENNSLGDVWLSGRQLSDFGIATRTFDGLESMEKFFLERTRLDPDALFEKNSYLDRVFSVAALEEYVRKRCGLFVKILDGGSDRLINVFTKERSVFSIKEGTQEDIAKVIACITEIDFNLAGHNLRVARRSK